MTKTLGQVAYDAYMTAVVGEPKPNRNITPAWQAAAEAVVSEVQLERIRAISPKEQRVIEAAKALYAAGSRVSKGDCLGVGYMVAIDGLYNAVEALKEVELG